MPPKKRSEQHDKTNISKNPRNSTGGRLARSKSPKTTNQGLDAQSTKSIPSWRLPRSAGAADYKTKIESMWKAMGNSRVGERQDAIRNGLIADPNKRTTLANAIRVVGTCQDMCPEFERIQRIRENAVDRAEKVSSQGAAKVADEMRMVKAFHRPDAGKEEQLPSDLRPPPVLQKTVRYLLDKVASPGSSLAEHHKFVWDRTRCIRNDFTIQASGRLEDIKITIQCYEEIARFHILSLHQMPKIGRHDYDAQQELEQLSATLLSLFELYDDNRGKYDAPQEAEFRAYKLIIDIRSRTNDTLERVQTWPPRIRDSSHVQTAVKLCQASGHLFTDTASMLSPYSRATRVEQASYERFWSILESPKVDYLMACAATVSFNEIRARALETMIKVYRSGPNSRMQDLTMEELSFALGFDSVAQTKRFFRDAGLQISQHANGASYLNVDEMPGPFSKAAITSADQLFSQSIVEAKREYRLFSAIYSGHNLTYCKEHNLVDEMDSDAEFEPDAAELDSEDENDGPLFVEDEETVGQHKMLQTTSTKTTATGENPFSRLRSREPSPQPKPMSFGGFGQPSGVASSSATAANASISAPTSNPFGIAPLNQSPFTSATSQGFGAPSKGLFTQATSLSEKPPGPATASPAETLQSQGVQPPAVAASVLGNTPATGLFQWKTPRPTASSQDGTLFPNQISNNFQSNQTTPDASSSALSSNNSTAAPKPLFPFSFPSATKGDTTKSLDTPTQAPQPTKEAILTADSSTTASLFSTFSNGPSVPPKSDTAEISLDPAQTSMFPGSKLPKPTTGVRNATDLTSAPPTFGVPATEASTTLFQHTASPANLDIKPKPSLPAPSMSINLGSTTADNTKPGKPERPVITQQQKDEILQKIARELALGPNGIIEQFIEAELGPIYDKAQKIVTKERIQTRLDEIKQSVLGGKFLYAWKRQVDQQMQRRKTEQRRERMRQLRHEGLNREPSVSETSTPIHEATGSSPQHAELKHLTRGFDETFEQSTSGHLSSPIPKERSRVSVTSDALVFSNGYKHAISTARAFQRSRHSRSQTLDSDIRKPTDSSSSSSMPPPSRFQISRTSNETKSSGQRRPNGIATVALRGEAMDFARRAGPVTTTSSDYFRLKARNIDPSTRMVPSTRKRHRESGGGAVDGVLSKTRRFSESTSSTMSLSESTRELLADASLSESTRSLLNSQTQSGENATNRSTTPRYTDEEDALFEAARRLRETLAEDTDWMRSMREEQENRNFTTKAETAAEKRLREFRSDTPSKTSVRLRQTHANGLLPPDYFERSKSPQHRSVDGSFISKEDMPKHAQTKVGLLALSTERPQRDRRTDQPKPLTNLGISIDDAIEL